MNKQTIKVFWRPGWTSCLRTKEFLSIREIEFESIDIQEQPDAWAELKRLGADSIPVVSRGDKFVYSQILTDVSDFLKIEPPEGGLLPAPVLVEKLDLILEAAQRFICQIPNDELLKNIRNRDRTLGHLAIHIFRIPEGFLAAANGGELSYDFLAKGLEPWMKGNRDIVEFGDNMRERVKTWWRSNEDVTCYNTVVKTYFGDRSMYEVLERTCWHSGQHVRQIMMFLEEDLKIKPDRPLSDADFSGLPMPGKVWDDEP